MKKALACSAVAVILVASSSGCSSSSTTTAPSHDASVAPDGHAPPDGTTSSKACTTDSQCASYLASLTPNPPGCAEAYCDTIVSHCAVRPVDDDEDTYRTADCSVPGVSFTPGTDCNNHDAKLYPGHPEPCTPDAGSDSGEYCSTGQVSCLANGKESACTSTCTPCDPGSLGCAGSQPQTCNGAGTAWEKTGEDCSTDQMTPVCLEGACVTCAPGALRCAFGATDGGAPGVIVVDGGVPALADGGVAPSQQPQKCNATGAWENNGGVCSAETSCVDGACSGVCGPGETQCAGDGLELCDTTGTWGSAAPCPAECCTGACTDVQSDVGNCGGCAVACTAATSPGCSAGVCNYTLASGQSNPEPIAVDATSVYWSAGSTVMKVALSGGTPVTLASAGGYAIAVDATSVYWTEVGFGRVMKVALTGGTVTTLATGQSQPWGIAVDATSVYWTTYEGGTVMKATLAGDTLATLASGQNQPTGIAVDATSVYWGNLNGSNENSGTVMKVDLSGGTPTTLASGQTSPQYIAVDATSVYWTTGSDGMVMKVALAGGAPTTLALGESDTTAIAVDSTSVYWTNETFPDADTGTVMKVALAGGAPTTLASGQNNPVGIAVDATSVYWTNSGGGTVMKAPK